ncbi:unnamed protein product [Lymnaea stagnalis]|uniref:protein-tyrosine-phosphatase n=1 Tax=Lymnaea stagnalis TaxID=6523 RepID=A0AAV2HPB6_LYMST
MVIFAPRSPCLCSARLKPQPSAAAPDDVSNKLANNLNGQMPEAGDVSVLAPTPLHHAPLHHNGSKLNNWNARRHLKLNLNIAQCHHSAGVSYNAANLSGRVGTSGPANSVNRPSRLGMTSEEAHMTSKKSKLDFCSLPFSTPASSLPGHPNHLHIQLVGSSSPTGNSIHPSEVVHYHQTFSSSSSASSYSYTCSSNPNPPGNNYQKTNNTAISPTTAFINNTRMSPLSSPVVNNCGCGIVCSAISSCTPPSLSTSPPRAKLKCMTSDELASSVSRSKPVLIIDVRTSNSYLRNHVQGAVNLCCTDRFNRRRIQQGKSTVFDILGIKDNSAMSSSPSTKRKSCNNAMDIVVYDDNTTLQDLAELSLTQESALCTVLTSLLRDGNDVHVLDGGFKSFSIDHEALCRCSSRNIEVLKPLLYSPTNGVQEPEIEAATASQVLPFLYLGNERDAKDLSRLKSLNISYVLNVTSHVPQYYDEEGIRYKRIPASDNAQQNLKQYFEEAIEYIDDARQNNAKILIHCHAGVSRSATITIAYLLKHTRMAMADAYKFVKGKRAIISPNFNFMGQLLEFEQDLNEGVSPRILQPRLQGIESSV